jgi:formylmethanofuran dehydrogenase subunit B
MTAICSVCGQLAQDVRIRTDQGAFGPVDVQTCRACHDAEVKAVRAEERRLGIPLKMKQWASLTTEGAYSEVVGFTREKKEGKTC